MSYTPPDRHSVEFSFVSGTYAPPSRASVEFDFGVSGDIDGLVVVEVTPESETAKDLSREFLTQTLVVLEGATGVSRSIEGDIAVVITNESDRIVVSNEGGRIELIAQDNYTPFPGDEIDLFVSYTKNYVRARELKATATATAELKGGMVFADDGLVALDLAAELKGAGVWTGDALPTTAFGVAYHGSMVHAGDKVPGVAILAGESLSFGVEGAFAAPEADVSIAEADNVLAVDAEFDAALLDASFDAMFDMVVEFTAPILSGAIETAVLSGIDADFDAPVLVAEIAFSQDWQIELSLDAPTLEANVLEPYWIEVDRAFAAPSLECTIDAGWWTDTVFTEPTAEIAIDDGGFTLDAAIDAPLADAAIEGGYALVLDALLPELAADIVILDSGDLTVIVDVDFQGPSISAVIQRQAYLSMDAAIDAPLLTGFDDNDMTLDARLPVISSSVVININHSAELEQWL